MRVKVRKSSTRTPFVCKPSWYSRWYWHKLWGWILLQCGWSGSPAITHMCGSWTKFPEPIDGSYNPFGPYNIHIVICIDEWMKHQVWKYKVIIIELTIKSPKERSLTPLWENLPYFPFLKPVSTTKRKKKGSKLFFAFTMGYKLWETFECHSWVCFYLWSTQVVRGAKSD